MSNQAILVVEDDVNVFELVRDILTREGFSVSGAMTGEDALFKARKHNPDLILLDLVLPGVDGLEVCKRLKDDERTQHIPIVMLTAKGDEADVVTGLEMGVDDYITKPFSPRVLLARLRVVIQRGTEAQPGEGESIAIHELVIHPGGQELIIDGKPIHLTFTEFKVLHCLTRRPGWVFTRNQIVEAVRGEDYVVTERAVDVQIAGLRKKLGQAGRYIETVRGVGYRFRE